MLHCPIPSLKSIWSMISRKEILPMLKVNSCIFSMGLELDYLVMIKCLNNLFILSSLSLLLDKKLLKIVDICGIIESGDAIEDVCRDYRL